MRKHWWFKHWRLDDFSPNSPMLEPSKVSLHTVLYCRVDERSAEGLFRSGTVAKQNRNVNSYELLVKRHGLIKSKEKQTVIHIAITELKQKYKCDSRINSVSPTYLTVCTN